MMRALSLLGLGAGLMYYFDPDRGRRRRALVRDQFEHQLHQLDTLSQKAGRDTRNRAQGLVAEGRALLTRDDAPDRVIAERIRSAMGRVVSRPSDIEVSVLSGRATVSGPILPDEVEPLLETVASTRGVIGVIDHLQPHYGSDTLSAPLHGRVRRRSSARPDPIPTQWDPSTRLLAGASGGALLLGGLSRGGLLGLASGLVGAGLISRSLADLPLQTLLGADGGNRAFESNDSITIQAPVEDVFAFLTNYENYPHILPNVREVRKLGPHHWGWTLVGPGGLSFEVEDVITRFEPNQAVAWHSAGQSELHYAGAARYVAQPDGSTTIHATMSYSPPGGALGHGLAWLSGYSPKQQLQQILLRTKSFLETGKVPHDASDPTPPPHHRVRAEA
ncbi:SRPBCC family protein [Tautonia rosea]|uniref:SRPBCC family protein n=1 Tax=Tautonia rosea TaxID=2728037 RepID=UPI001474F328|nr:SRPBCC family protein [Tautonia rosea]